MTWYATTPVVVTPTAWSSGNVQAASACESRDSATRHRWRLSWEPSVRAVPRDSQIFFSCRRRLGHDSVRLQGASAVSPCGRWRFALLGVPARVRWRMEHHARRHRHWRSRRRRRDALMRTKRVHLVGNRFVQSPAAFLFSGSVRASLVSHVVFFAPHVVVPRASYTLSSSSRAAFTDTLLGKTEDDESRASKGVVYTNGSASGGVQAGKRINLVFSCEARCSGDGGRRGVAISRARRRSRLPRPR